MGEAAKSAIGANPVTRTTKIRDIFVMIIIPFAIPALVLALANGSNSLTLPNIAFGFIAVSVAGIVRAITSKTDEWLAYVLVAVTCVVFQTALAVVDDTSNANAALRELVLTTHTPNPSAVASIRMAAHTASAAPSIFHWTFCVTSGVALMILSFELIRRER